MRRAQVSVSLGKLRRVLARFLDTHAPFAKHLLFQCIFNNRRKLSTAIDGGVATVTVTGGGCFVTIERHGSGVPVLRRVTVDLGAETVAGLKRRIAVARPDLGTASQFRLFRADTGAELSTAVASACGAKETDGDKAGHQPSPLLCDCGIASGDVLALALRRFELTGHTRSITSVCIGWVGLHTHEAQTRSAQRKHTHSVHTHTHTQRTLITHAYAFTHAHALSTHTKHTHTHTHTHTHLAHVSTHKLVPQLVARCSPSTPATQRTSN